MIILEFAIWCSLEACKRLLADIQIGRLLQRGNARQHFGGNTVPGGTSRTYPPPISRQLERRWRAT